MALQFRDLHRPGCLGNVSGELRRGRVTAVLGPSGAGKTSFFSVLSGRLAASEGTILLNGQRTSLSEHKSLLGFVTEDDALLPLFSVEETLDFAAAVRLSAKVTPHERTQLVNRLLHVLGLSHIRHSRVGQGAALAGVRGVSFGERRRLSIGVELAGLPQILLVDDATCGLDSRTAREVVATLGRVAENGLTVAAILHQPSWPLLSRIDDVLCIGRGGYAVYCGPTTEALAYFASAGQRRRILTHPRTPQPPANPLLIPGSPCSAGFACPEQLSPTVFLLELLGGHPHVSAPREGSRADEAGAVHGRGSEEGATRLASRPNGGGDADACAHELLRALAQLWCLHLESEQMQSAQMQSKLRSAHGEAWPLPTARREPRFLVQLRLYTRRACMLVLRRWRKTSLE